MSDPVRFAKIIVIASSVLLLIVLVCVHFRSQSPQWKTYQVRGVELRLSRLKAELQTDLTNSRRETIRKEMNRLTDRPLQVVEIRPFGGKLEQERCMTCHFGIEDTSKSHPNDVFGCVICHGGNPAALTVDEAHFGLRNGRNPARLDMAAVSCGSHKPDLGACHSYREHPNLNRADNVPKSLMATNAGIIGIMRFQWGIQDSSSSEFAIQPVSDGKISLKNIPGEITKDGKFNLANSHFRKFCATCHLWTPRHRATMGRLEGCAACHAPYANDGRYHGGDPTVDRNEVGHASTHTITNLVPDDRCRACHNRSARIGLNYHGEMESAQYGAPFVKGKLNNQTLSDGRFFLNLTPDIHQEKGMACIDCHTGQDTMGDGKLYGHMQEQVEIRCADCHGSPKLGPKSITVTKDNHVVQALVTSSPNVKVSDGDEILVTSKGRPLPHVRKTAKGYVLTSKLDGKEHPVTIITGKKDSHKMRGHERLTCDTCHSAWSPQCYGCHQVLDFRYKGLDHVSKQQTNGRWAEGRSYFRFERHIYGIDSRGKVGILVPGCQVWNTMIDDKGKIVGSYDSRVIKLKNGLTSIAMGATHPHTTRKEASRCIDCHLDPKALGLGEGRLRRNSDGTELEFRPLYDSGASGLKIDFPLEAISDINGNPLQSTSHKLSRPFNQKEIRKIIAIAPCLPCHDRYDDPVWQNPGPYEEKPPCRKAIESHISLKAH